MGGKRLDENVLRTFVYVFLIVVMKVSYGVVSYGTDEGVWVGRASVEKVSSQMVNEVADRSDVSGGIKTRCGGAWNGFV